MFPEEKEDFIKSLILDVIDFQRNQELVLSHSGNETARIRKYKIDGYNQAISDIIKLLKNET